jgi:thiamine biosynthesis protein ThiS
MQITVNGNLHETADNATVAQLLEELGVQPQAMIVQRNDDIVDRGHFADTTLAAGDRLELVRLVGGG